MPNIQSSIKSMKKDAARNRRNNMRKSLLKTSLRKFQTAMTEGDPEKVKDVLLQTTRVIDKSASKGIIHKNAAARRKSRLAKKYNQLVAAHSETATQDQ